MSAYDPTTTYRINDPKAAPIDIPGATPTKAGVMTAAQAAAVAGQTTTVIQPLDALIAQPTAGGVSTTGGATLPAITVPDGMTQLRVSQGGPRLIGVPVGDSANLSPGSLVVFQNGVVLTPSAGGVYTVTPGASIVIGATVINIFGSSPKTAPTNLWAVEFRYGFSA